MYWQIVFGKLISIPHSTFWKDQTFLSLINVETLETFVSCVMWCTRQHTASSRQTGTPIWMWQLGVWYCKTGNFHDRKISRIRGVGRFATGKDTVRKNLRTLPRGVRDRKFSRICRFSRKSQNFPAHGNFLFYSKWFNIGSRSHPDNSIMVKLLSPIFLLWRNNFHKSFYSGVWL